MRTEYFLFVHHNTSILSKFTTLSFEQSGDINCSLDVNSSHTDESSEGRNARHWIYALNIFTEDSGEHWWEQNMFCSFTTPPALWQSSVPGTLRTRVISLVLYSLTRATLMSAGKDEACGCRYTLSIYSMRTLKKTDANSIFFVRSGNHKDFGTAKHLIFWALWWDQLFSTR